LEDSELQEREEMERMERMREEFQKQKLESEGENGRDYASFSGSRGTAFMIKHLLNQEHPQQIIGLNDLEEDKEVVDIYDISEKQPNSFDKL